MGGHRGRIVAGLAVIACAAAAVVPFASAERRSDRQPVVGKPKLDAHGCARIPKSLRPLSDWPRVTSRVQDSKQVERRAQQLLSGMTLEEKVGQMTQPEITSITPAEVGQYHIGSVLNGGGAWPGGNKHASQADWLALADAYWQASIDDQGIPVIWGIDAVHGNSNIYAATLFPHNIGLGAAHDPCLVRRVQKATAEQVRSTGQDWAFAPTLAVVRDDRWGRTYEGFSEDPRIARAYGYEAMKGLQDSDRHGIGGRRRDRHRQALHRRRWHRGRQGPGRQPLLRGRDDQRPRPGLLRRARRGRPVRDDLVQLVDERGARDHRGQAARLPQGDHRDPQGQDGLRRPRGLRLERHRPGRGLHERELPAGRQRRDGHRDGARRTGRRSSPTPSPRSRAARSRWRGSTTRSPASCA